MPSSVLLLTPLAGCGACTFRVLPAFWPTCLRAEAYDGETHGLRCSPGPGVRLAYEAPVRSTVRPDASSTGGRQCNASWADEVVAVSPFLQQQPLLTHIFGRAWFL